MLKRSLALGALMAFVITGSAFADNGPTGYQKDEFYSISRIASSETNGFLVKYTGESDNTVIVSSEIGKTTYSYTFNTNDNKYNAFTVFGQSYKDDGKDVTFNDIVDIDMNTNSARNATGQGNANGISIYDGNLTFGKDLTVDVHATDSVNGSAISVTGITAWGYKKSDNHKPIINLKGNTTINVSTTDISDGEAYPNVDGNTNPLYGLPGTVTGIALQPGATLNLDLNKILSVTAKSEGIVTNDVVDGATAYAMEFTGGTANLDGIVKLTAEAKDGLAYGVYATNKGYTDTTGEFTGPVDANFNGATTITATSNSGEAYGLFALNNTTAVDITGDLTVNATGVGNTAGVYARFGADINVNNEKAKVNITANSSKDWAFGVRAYSHSINGNNSDISIVADEVNITANATGDTYAWGVYSSSDTTAGKSDIKINANKTVITADAEGNNKAMAIVTFSGSETSIAGDLEANGDFSVYTRGSAKTYINADEDGAVLSEDATVVLNGDIAYNAGSNSPMSAEVFVNFVGSDSEFNGSIVTTDVNDIVDKNLISQIDKGATLGFYNGAKWNLKDESIVNDVTFGEGSVLNIEGSKYTEDVYALNAVGNKKSLTVEQGAILAIKGIEEGTTYNIAKGFNVEKTEGEKWTIDNNLLTGTWNVVTGDGLQVTTVAKEADEIAKDMGVDSGTADALAGIIDAVNDTTSTPTEAQKNVQAFANAIANVSPEVAAAAAEAVVKMAEAGGNNATAASIVKNVTGVTNDRLSFNCGHSAPHKGGHGVGLFEEGSGADIWVEYVHGKDEVEDMKSSAGATSYEGSYDGIVMGVDFKKVNKFQSGIAFNYGEGDTNSVGTLARTRSDYDFWGIGYYGNIHNDDSNVIFDINYAKSDSDVTNYNVGGLTYEASPETTTWTAGVKVEKLYQNNNVQIVPYTGLRYMSIDADDYATKCGTFNYKMDRQDIWLLPVGVSIRQEVTNDNGWTVSPRVDLSYIWAFGDTDSDMEFATAYNNKVTNIGYDVMDDGSFLGLVGIEAHKGQWGYGVAYSYQKGDHSESKKWFVDVNYSF